MNVDGQQESGPNRLSSEETQAAQSLPLFHESETVDKRTRKSVFFEFSLHSGPEPRPW